MQINWIQPLSSRIRILGLVLALCSRLYAAAPWDHGKLIISPNRHFIIHEDKTPFFFLADTAWEVLLRGTDNEITRYLDLRQAQEYNAVITIIHGDDVIQEWNCPNREGNRPHLPPNANGDPTRLNEPFWKRVDWFMRQCEDRGMYVVLAPTWTRFWCSTDDTGRVKAITKDNAYAYGHAIGSWYNPEFWEQGLVYPGAAQMRHIKALMLSRPFTGRIPDQQVILNNFPPGAEKEPNLRYMMGTRGDGYIMIYTHLGDKINVKLGQDVLTGSGIKAWWFNPANGDSTLIGTYANSGARTFDPPGESARGNDWVLVVDDASKGWGAPGGERRR